MVKNSVGMSWGVFSLVFTRVDSSSLKSMTCRCMCILFLVIC